MRSGSSRPRPRRSLGAIALLAAAAAGLRSGAARARAEVAEDGSVAAIWAGRERQVLARLAPYAVGQEIAAGFRLKGASVGREFFQIVVEGPGGTRGTLLLAPRDRAPRGTAVLPSFAAWIDQSPVQPGAADPRPALEALMDALRRNDDGRFWEAPPDAADSRATGPGGGGASGGGGVVVLALAALAAGGAALLVRRRRARGDASAAGSGRLLPGVIVASAAAMAFALRGVETDDAYTVLRYARNLVDHGELTYNLGERICALTSPLHALVVAALYRVTGALVVPNRVLGVACAITAALAVALPLRGRGAALCVALALFPASPFVLYWALGGLETPLLAALLAVLAALALSELRDPGRTGALSAARATLPFALGGLAVLTRLDAVVFVAPVLLGLALQRRRARLALAVAAVVATPGAWFAFADRYYGHLLPTSFYVKTPRLDPLWVLGNAAYMAELALFSGLAVVVGAAAVLAAVRPGARGALRAQVREFVWLYAGLGGVVVYGLVAATTHLFYAFRLFVPFLGPAALLAGDLVARLRAGAVAPEDPAGSKAEGGAIHEVFGGAAVVVLAMQWLSFVQLAAPGGNVSGSRGGELREVGVLEMAEWVTRFAAPADAIRRDWVARHAAEGGAARPPRLMTFAVGSLAFTLPEAQIYEQHTAYRHQCRPSPGELAATADYVCVLSPAPEEAELGLDRMEKLFEVAAPLAGTPRRYQVFHNPSPAPPLLPPRIDEPCTGSPRPR